MPTPSLQRPRNSGLVLAGLVVLVAFASWWAWRHHADQASGDDWRTAPVQRGDIRVAISATGTLSAISTVDVGSQISGQVTDVLVDFNDHVRKGEVLARIDPSTYQAQIAQGNAAAGSARASLASAQAALRNAQVDYDRKASLGQRQLVARSDVDAARAARDQARAQADAAQAQIGQQLASTETARLNLQRTVIRSPVDGVVLTRTIEPGQTVAASLQAPVLFQIAEDLSQMQILLAVDEADIGQVKPGQSVGFTVDAFPDRRYRGTVQQVRLSSTSTSNVITYPVVVAVRNDDQSLLPGMTANAEIEISLHRDVLEVPNAALRFHPPEEAAAANGGGARTGGMADALPPIAAGLHLAPAQQAAFDAALSQLR
ncbi:MAG TPA: efflux RND transporter periplasmic adaptor subunit, partial [Xanthomonadaceae bacterium]|nr:efflux RND transporter periplasmic adaptor subunit [Xanthomonadaceae bacterium]